MHPTLPVKKDQLFLSYLVGQLEFENVCLFFCCFKESSLVPKIQQISCLVLCVFFTLDKIWLSGKFHLILCLEQYILKINFASREVLKSMFLWRQQSYLWFHGGSSNGILPWIFHNGRRIDLWKLIFQIADPTVVNICDQILDKRSKSHISQNQYYTTNG